MPLGVITLLCPLNRATVSGFPYIHGLFNLRFMAMTAMQTWIPSHGVGHEFNERVVGYTSIPYRQATTVDFGGCVRLIVCRGPSSTMITGQQEQSFQLDSSLTSVCSMRHTRIVFTEMAQPPDMENNQLALAVAEIFEDVHGATLASDSTKCN